MRDRLLRIKTELSNDLKKRTHFSFRQKKDWGAEVRSARDCLISSSKISTKGCLLHTGLSLGKSIRTWPQIVVEERHLEGVAVSPGLNGKVPKLSEERGGVPTTGFLLMERRTRSGESGEGVRRRVEESGEGVPDPLLVAPPLPTQLWVSAPPPILLPVLPPICRIHGHTIVQQCPLPREGVTD